MIEEDSKDNIKKDDKLEKPNAPVLLENSYMDDGQKENRPPYIFIILVLFVILSFIWKRYMAEKVDAEAIADKGSVKVEQPVGR